MPAHPKLSLTCCAPEWFASCRPKRGSAASAQRSTAAAPARCLGGHCRGMWQGWRQSCWQGPTPRGDLGASHALGLSFFCPPPTPSKRGTAQTHAPTHCVVQHVHAVQHMVYLAAKAARAARSMECGPRKRGRQTRQETNCKPRCSTSCSHNHHTTCKYSAGSARVLQTIRTAYPRRRVVQTLGAQNPVRSALRRSKRERRLMVYSKPTTTLDLDVEVCTRCGVGIAMRVEYRRKG